MEYPYLVTRLKAVVIDLLLVLLIFILASYLFDQFEEVPNFIRATVYIVSVYLYEPFMVAKGGTLGHRLMGIKVKRSDDFECNIGLVRAVIRFILKILLGWWTFFQINPQKQGLHDLASKSIVLYNQTITNETSTTQ